MSLIDENSIVPEVNLLLPPEDLPEDVKKYLNELVRDLENKLRGSSYMQKVLEDGIFGN